MFMNKKRKKTIIELIQENKENILKDKAEIEKIYMKMDQKASLTLNKVKSI